jgi:geranylgeranyl pyrophosphate synthase
MIHCSSLIHDDVIDSGEIRRGMEAVHMKVGNKAAVLGGDYLISTASYVCS